MPKKDKKNVWKENYKSNSWNGYKNPKWNTNKPNLAIYMYIFFLFFFFKIMSNLELPQECEEILILCF